MIPSKTDYPKMLELLDMTKKEYIREKTEILMKLDKDQKKIPEVKITDEDLVPLELLRQTLGQIKNKFTID